MKLSNIHHVAIIVSDYAASREFYVGKLGFKIVRENRRDDKHDWKLDVDIGDGTELEIFCPDAVAPKRLNYPEAQGLRHLAFRVESVEDTVRELEGLGIECENVRTDPFTNSKMTFFHDPDGLPLEIHE